MKTNIWVLRLAGGFLVFAMFAAPLTAQERSQSGADNPAQAQEAQNDQTAQPAPSQDSQSPDSSAQNNENPQRIETGPGSQSRPLEELKPEEQDEQKLNLTLQIFELKHAKPQELMQLLRMHHGFVAYYAGAGGYGFGGYPGAGFAAYPQQGQQNVPTVRIAADEEKGVLFVRGPEKQVQEIGRLIKAFDAPLSEMSKGEQLEGRYLLPIDRERAQQVSQILQQLQFACQTLNIGDATLLVIQAEGDDLEQAKEVIAKLEESDKAEGRKKKAPRQQKKETEQSEPSENDDSSASEQ